jgi:hypothetical protein
MVRRGQGKRRVATRTPLGPQLLDRRSPPYTFFLLNGDMELHRNR